jgi:hypothetical protein
MVGLPSRNPRLVCKGPARTSRLLGESYSRTGPGLRNRSMETPGLTRTKVHRINREVILANRATPALQLREEFTLARTEILTAVSKAPEELEDRSPLARIVHERCVLHGGHHLEQLRKCVAQFAGIL